MKHLMPSNILSYFPADIYWTKIHNVNFFCTIDTRLRSFYFKIFHNAIAFNSFLFKIKRRDSPNCNFCNILPETIVHILCDCKIVSPIWKKIVDCIRCKHDPNFSLSSFSKLFGVVNEKYLSFCF